MGKGLLAWCVHSHAVGSVVFQLFFITHLSLLKLCVYTWFLKNGAALLRQQQRGFRGSLIYPPLSPGLSRGHPEDLLQFPGPQCRKQGYTFGLLLVCRNLTQDVISQTITFLESVRELGL